MGYRPISPAASRDPSVDPATGATYTSKHPESGRPIGIVRGRIRDGVQCWELTDGSVVSREAFAKANTVHPEPTPSARNLSVAQRLAALERRVGMLEGPPVVEAAPAPPVVEPEVE